MDIVQQFVKCLQPFPPLYRVARAAYRAGGDINTRLRQRRERRLTRRFHELFYNGPVGQHGLWFSVTWLGVPAQKCPFDLTILQEIVCETRPELIIECGVNYGGTTLFLATLCDALGTGRVLACDITLSHVYPQVKRHPRIELVESSSTADGFRDRARQEAAGRRVMVILDSDHSREHVLQELRLYAPLVSPGCYLICEDTNINGHPVHETYGPGPQEALQEYLREAAPLWTVDRTRERFLVTFNPGGYLWRKAEVAIVPGG